MVVLTMGATDTWASTKKHHKHHSHHSQHKKAAAGLSGSWSGKYGGAYQGTFTLTWQQSGTTLSGAIKLSSVGGSVSVHGTLNGNTITFGTVGSTVITYTGTVSGNSMSGTYQTPGGGGTWSATKP